MPNHDHPSKIQVSTVGKTAVLRFDSPESRNTLSVETQIILKTHITDLEKKPAIMSCIFTGSGNTFASGANLTEVSALDSDSAVEFGRRGQNLMQSIANSRLTMVAAINGYCMGGALDMALACDYRIAVAGAMFAHPGGSLGIITGWGGTQMLPPLVCRKNAFELFLTAKRIEAIEAKRIGLIDEISDDVLAAAFNYCGETT
jgi:enoyl-CoA hydratase